MKTNPSLLTKMIKILMAMVLSANLAGWVAPVQAHAGNPPTWQEITPRGGSIGVIVAYSNTGIYLATNDGVFRKSGKGWVQINTGLNNLSISGLVVDPKNARIVYASTYFDNQGVYKSVDGGAHWALSNNGISGEVRGLAINPQNGSVLYAQTASQVYRSDDAGASWQLKSQGILTGDGEGDMISMKIAPSNPSILYISEISGHLYRTVDGGETWAKTAPLLGERAWTLTIGLSSADTVYVGTAGDGVYLTSDGGQTWVKRNKGMPNHGAGQSLNAILIDPHKPAILYASMNSLGLYKTTDAGQHWTRLTSVGQYTSPISLAASPSAANTIYAGYNGPGFYESSNGGMSWSTLNDGLSRLGVHYAVSDPKNANVVYVSSSGLLKSSNQGANWKPMNNGLEFADFPAIAIDPVNNSNVYLGADGGGFYRSKDAGTTWTHTFIGPDVVEVIALAVDPVHPNNVYAGAFDHGVFKSTDYGKTWKPTGLQGDATFSLAIDPHHPNIVYAVADGVWKSTDGGTHFKRANNGIDEPCGNQVVVDPLAPATVYVVGCNTGLVKSTNSGAKWTSIIIPNIADGWVSAFALDPQRPWVLYAAANKHLYRSPDAGATWRLFEDGLPVPWQIDRLEVSPVGRGCVYAAGFYTPGMFSTCTP